MDLKYLSRIEIQDWMVIQFPHLLIFVRAEIYLVVEYNLHDVEDTLGGD